MFRVVAASNLFKTSRLAVVGPSLIRFYNAKHIDIQANPEYSLASFIPDSIVEWDPTRNGDLHPTQIPYNYAGVVWWKCPHGEDHIWKSKCSSRVDRENKRLLDCPFCSNRKVSKTNSLLTKYPLLASEFDMLSNGGLKASDVIYNRKRPFFWRCIHNHVYKMTIPKRLEMMENGDVSCPTCRLADKPSTLLYDYDSDLFEESYNWLNCPSLPPPSIEEKEEELPTDFYKSIDFQELYVQEDNPLPSQLPSTSSYFHADSMNPIDTSLKRSFQNHILEYQKWKESLHWNDKRVIWWVCNEDPSHVWRESVRSRVGKCSGMHKIRKVIDCPFCYEKHLHSENRSSGLSDDSVVTF